MTSTTINICYPSFKECLSRCGSLDMNLTDFIKSIINESGFIDPINLDPNYLNIAVVGMIPPSKSDRYEDLNGFTLQFRKPVKYYVFQVVNQISLLGVIPYIIGKVQINGQFDYLYISRVNKLDNVESFYDKLKCPIVYFGDFNEFPLGKLLSGTTEINEQLKIYPFQSYVKNRFRSHDKIKECDLNIAQILPYIRESISVFHSISVAIDSLIVNTKISITLNPDTHNILVLCATTETVERHAYKELIRLTLGDVDYDSSSVYSIGPDIRIEIEPTSLRVRTENFSLNPDSPKFDMIIVEYCPYYAFYDNDNVINSLLADDGVILSPTYNNTGVQKAKLAIFLENFRIIENDNNNIKHFVIYDKKNN